MNADGSGQVPITNNAFDDRRVAFSPDGSRVVFARDTDLPSDGSTDEIFTALLNGTGEVNVTNSGKSDFDADPDWQPIPVSCGGRTATQVGTAGKNTLVGTTGVDVLAGLGGRDILSGLSGKDILCGGPGKDTLRGGTGKDRLLGQAGKDLLWGGKGVDTCKGGKGKDTATGCEKGKV